MSDHTRQPALETVPDTPQRRRDPSAVVQLKSQLAALPVSEQLEAVRPSAPLQFQHIEDTPVQMAAEAVQFGKGKKKKKKSGGGGGDNENSGGSDTEHQPMTNAEAKEAAEALGFTKVKGAVAHGSAVFTNGKMFITADQDGHIGGVWKGAKGKWQNLLSKSSRSGTYDAQLKRIGD
jgi:hypothetical protein